MSSVPVGDLKFLGGSFADGCRFEFSSGQPAASSSSVSLVLDGESGKLVRAPPPRPLPSTSGGKRAASGGGASDAKTAMALKNHSEAERRRRERINSHLAKLRGMVPSSEKLDKAALLAEVIKHVKELKRKAVEVSKDYTLPSDVDEVRVEADGDVRNNGRFVITASLCCEDRPELLMDLKQALQSLQLKTVRAEISMSGGRMKNVLVMMSEGNSSDVSKHLCMTSLHQALKSILDKVNSQVDFLPRTSFPNKRRRISYFESSSSSC